jgi:hypothetical protein
MQAWAGLMLRKQKICTLSQAKFRNYSPCEEAAEYRLRATVSNGQEFVLYLCCSHMPHAWELAQVLMDRRFADSGAKYDLRLECISFHQLTPSPRLIHHKSLRAA